MVEKIKIINSFGLQVEEIEPLVLRVLNSDTYVEIDNLQDMLEESIAIVSNERKWKKLTTGLSAEVVRVYYIILSYSDRELARKYDEIALHNFGKVRYKPYKKKENINDFIGTIYSKDEF